jgi:hypothetical protein
MMKLGYIPPGSVAKVLEPDQSPDMSDASNMSALGRIYPT